MEPRAERRSPSKPGGERRGSSLRPFHLEQQRFGEQRLHHRQQMHLEEQEDESEGEEERGRKAQQQQQQQQKQLQEEEERARRRELRREQAEWSAFQLRKEAKRRAEEERKRRCSIMPNDEDAEEGGEGVGVEEDREGWRRKRSSSNSSSPWARGHHRASASTFSFTPTATATSGSLLGVLVRILALCLLIVVLLLLGRWGSAWTMSRSLERGGEEVSLSSFSSGSPLIPRLEGLYSAEGQACSSASTLSVTQSDVFVTLSSSSGAHPLQVPMMVLLPTPVVSAGLPDELPLILLHSSGSSDARQMRQSLLEGHPLREAPRAGAVILDRKSGEVSGLWVHLDGLGEEQEGPGAHKNPTVLHRCSSAGASSSSPSASVPHGGGGRQGGGPMLALIEAERLIRWASREHLLSNELCGTSAWGQDFCFFRPAQEKYPPFQWQWDEAMHMVAWAHMDVERSARSMRSMLSMQQPDGRVPQIIFWLPEWRIHPRAILSASALVLLLLGLLLLLSPNLCAFFSKSKIFRPSEQLLLPRWLGGSSPSGHDATSPLMPRQRRGANGGGGTGAGAPTRRCSLSGLSSLTAQHRPVLRGVGFTLLFLALCLALARWLLLPVQPSFSDERVSDLVQTPLLPWALRRMVDQHPQPLGLVREFVPPLVAYLEWWATTRDVDGDGLVSILHPWESGLDSSPMYDVFHAALDAMQGRGARGPPGPGSASSDAVHDDSRAWVEEYLLQVAEEGWTRPSKEDIYPHFAELLFKYSGPDFAWNQTSILSEGQPCERDACVQAEGTPAPEGGEQQQQQQQLEEEKEEAKQQQQQQRHQRQPIMSFNFKDVGVNAVYAAGWAVLRDLVALLPAEETLMLDLRRSDAAAAPTGSAEQQPFSSGLLEGLARGTITAGHLAQFCDARYRRALIAIQSRMWSDKHQRFMSLFSLPGETQDRASLAEGAQTLFPLLLPDLDRDKVQAIVHGQLLEPSKFWRRFPVPSVSADSPGFSPVFRDNLMWRGPSWPVLSWIATEGLVQQGFHREARALVLRWAEMVLRSGVWEQYSPETGNGFGPRGLGMTTSLVDALRRVDFTEDLLSAPSPPS